MVRKTNLEPFSGQLVSYIPNSYAERTSRPIYALIYLLGFLLFYEVGTLLIQPETWQSLAEPQMRVVAFVWVQDLLKYLGFSARMTWVAAPLVVVVILLALQFTSKKSWKINFGDFVLMTAECIFLSIPLIVLSLLLNRASPEQGAAVVTASPGLEHRLLVDVITGIGAGIYEELIFRLIMICLLMLLFQDLCGLDRKASIIISVFISAVLFSVHHHFFFANGHFYRGDSFTVGKFIFRALAGVYFAVLYAVRGFGITAGSHAFYNIIAAVLRLLFF
ncbi:MAG: CPBP family intramembrane metalloprotease [Planctomycetaceae bacterium]|nr:CPBP family intramembrane metalloprotease [Planctomycetaceae bacterium]